MSEFVLSKMTDSWKKNKFCPIASPRWGGRGKIVIFVSHKQLLLVCGWTKVEYSGTEAMERYLKCGFLLGELGKTQRNS